MTAVTTRRRCPYCGASLVLGTLPIVATTLEKEDIGTTRARNGVDPRWVPRSGAPTRGYVGRWPIVAAPPIPDNGTGWWSRLRRPELPRPAAVADPQDLPARVCTRCSRPLPEDLDERDVFTIAVLGSVGAGKSHYLASMFLEAARDQRLRGLGCSEFVLDERSSREYDTGYFDPVFRHQRQLGHTQNQPDLVRNPLACRVRFAGGPPVLLYFHDIAGESLTDRTRRAAEAWFLRWADAVIYLVDPLCLTRPDGRRWDEDTALGEIAYTSQADLLNAVVHELGPKRRDRVPIAITLSKSDLLRPFAPAGGWEFLRAPDTRSFEEWDASLRRVDAEVRRLLVDWRAHDILAAADLLDPAQVVFRAVAPIGGNPDPGSGRLPVPRPLRCLDPLVTVLFRIPGLTRAA